MITAAFLVTFMVYCVSSERSSYLDRYTTQSPYDSDRYNRYDYTTRSPYDSDRYNRYDYTTQSPYDSDRYNRYDYTTQSPYDSDRYNRYDYTSRRPSYQTDRWGDVLGGTTRSPWGRTTDRWGHRETTDYQWTTDRWGGRGGSGSGKYWPVTTSSYDSDSYRYGPDDSHRDPYHRNDRNEYVRVVAELKRLTNDKGINIDGHPCDPFGDCDTVFKVFLDTERPNAEFPGAREVKQYTKIHQVEGTNSLDVRNGTVKRDVCGVPFRGAVLRVLVEDKDDVGDDEVINKFDCKIEGEPGNSEYSMWHDGVCTTRKQSDKMKLTFRYKVYTISSRECDSHSWSSGYTTPRRRY